PADAAVGRVEADHAAAVAGDGDQLPVDIAGRRAGGRLAEAAPVPLPDDLEVLEVRGVDLVGWRVAVVPGVAAQVRPLAVLDAGALRGGRGGQREGEAEGERERQDEPRRGRQPLPARAL